MARRRAWMLVPVVVFAGVAACSGPEFDARGLMPPSDYCPVDPRQLGRAEQLPPINLGNGSLASSPTPRTV